MTLIEIVILERRTCLQYIKKSGINKRKEGEFNKEQIIHFFENNPNATQVDCAKYLNLTRETVCRHIKKLKPKI